MPTSGSTQKKTTAEFDHVRHVKIVGTCSKPRDDPEIDSPFQTQK